MRNTHSEKAGEATTGMPFGFPFYILNKGYRETLGGCKSK